VFACIGEGERKKGDFGSKISKLEKVKYGPDAREKRRKAYKYWGFEAG
jgi:hypothetical protein